MPDPGVMGGALGAGLLVGGAVAVGVGRGPIPDVRRWTLGRLQAAHTISTRLDWSGWLAAGIERAGWGINPRHLTFVLAGLTLGGGLPAFALAPMLAPLGLAAGMGTGLLAMSSAGERRRRRLEGQLVPLLELFTLELSGGGSALSALGSVAVQVEGELATDLRRMLIAAQLAGSSSFEARLIEYSERLRIPAVGTLATILTASREYGTGTGQGVRALATDLRRGQRRELIARSRKALNHVLLPAAFGVLLPFLGILMFPAVSVLQRSLR